MDRLDLRLVESFVAVAEELHFGRAAERLHIAQPSLSQQIRRLEAQLGVALFTRTSRSVQLTPAGDAFLREGRKSLRQGSQAIRAARAAGAARLAVGFYGSAASSILPGVLGVFAERHPAVEVTVHELRLGTLDDILDAKVDVAFTRLLPGQAELEVAVLTHEPRVLALAANHPLAVHGSLVFADLRDESFIVNPAIPDERPPARWLQEQTRHGLRGRVAAEAGSIEEILTLVAARRGVCLVPASVAAHYPRADLAYVPVVDAAPAVISLAWRREACAPLAAGFIETAREVTASTASIC